MKFYKRNRSYNWLFKRRAMRNRIIQTISFLLILLFAAKCSLAQDKTLSPEQVIQIVRKYHPVAKQADINIEKAKADITVARGMFDPLLYNSSAQKKFDGTSYYYYNRPELIIPTWFGIELSAGLEYLSGSRTDPQETQGKTSYVGINIPLARNVLMDKRRAALQTAKIYKAASEAEKKTILNDLLLDAVTTYWNWVKRYQLYSIISNTVKVNEQRLDLIRISFRQGDRPAIDTTEALTQLQSFQILQAEAWMQFQNEGLILSAFLWTENDRPYVLPADITPDRGLLYANIAGIVLPELNTLLEKAANSHPELAQYAFKMDALLVERKLKFQQLLPMINFQYNQLSKGYDFVKISNGLLFDNNYRYGISIGLPLRFSQGRGEYKKAKLAIVETQLQMNQKTLVITNKIRSIFNELATLQNQAVIQENIYLNYLTLQRGEETRFQTGESSLFLVNSRENKTLEALQKLTELKAKYFQCMAKLNWAAGILGQL